VAPKFAAWACGPVPGGTRHPRLVSCRAASACGPVPRGGTFQRTTPPTTRECSLKSIASSQGGRTRDEPASRSPRPLSQCDLEMIYSCCTKEQTKRESRASPLHVLDCSSLLSRQQRRTG